MVASVSLARATAASQPERVIGRDVDWPDFASRRIVMLSYVSVSQRLSACTEHRSRKPAALSGVSSLESYVTRRRWEGALGTQQAV